MLHTARPWGPWVLTYLFPDRQEIYGTFEGALRALRAAPPGRCAALYEGYEEYYSEGRLCATHGQRINWDGTRARALN